MTKLTTAFVAVFLLAGSGLAYAQTTAPTVPNPADPAPANPKATNGAPAENSASSGAASRDSMMKKDSMMKSGSTQGDTMKK